MRKSHKELEGENAALRGALRMAYAALSQDRLALKSMEQNRFQVIRTIEGVLNEQGKRKEVRNQT